jgi:leucyl aminopeptidase (aminopeptidase T)
MEISKELMSAAKVAVVDCMGLKLGETVLVITDEPLRKIGHALWRSTKEQGNEAILTEIIPRKSNGENPPPAVAELMTKVDLVLCPTSKSLTHTDARRAASAVGVRIGTLPGVTEEIMVRCMNADYHAIADRTHRVCRRMEQTKLVRVTAPGGTDITFPIAGRKAHASTGLFREKGLWGNLPTGEAYLAPVEGEAKGVVVVDGSMAGIGKLSAPIQIAVRDGFAEEITGGPEAAVLQRLLEPHGKPARTVAEFGIGTNDKAILSGVILEDEKVMGTIHIAFGDNASMGGTVHVASHLDGLVLKPTVTFDGVEVMKDGQLLI